MYNNRFLIGSASELGMLAVTTTGVLALLLLASGCATTTAPLACSFCASCAVMRCTPGSCAGVNRPSSARRWYCTASGCSVAGANCALRDAVALDPRQQGVPSTKGAL